MVRVKVIEKSEKSYEIYLTKSYKTTIANGSARRWAYCPIAENRVVRLCREHHIVDSASSVYEELKGVFDKGYELDQTSLVLFPFYVVDRPTNRSDIKALEDQQNEESDADDEEEEDSLDSYDEDEDFAKQHEHHKSSKKKEDPPIWNSNKEHTRFFTEAVNLLKFKDGSHPIILYPDDQDVNPRYVYFEMKKDDLAEIAEAFYGFILRNKRIENVFIPDISLARIMFPELNIPKALKDAVYNVYDADISPNRSIKVMLIPSPIQLNKLEEKGWEFCQEIFEIAKNRRPSPQVPVTIISTVSELEKILNELSDSGVQRISVDTETTGYNPVYFRQAIISCSFSDGKKAWSFLVNHPKKPEFDGSPLLLYLLNYTKIPIYVFQNAKFDIKWFMYLFNTVPKVKIRDTMLLDHWLHENYGSLSKKLKVSILSMEAQTARYLYMPSHKSMLDKYIDVAQLRNPTVYKKAKDMDITDDLLPIVERHSQDMHEPRSGAFAELPLDVLLKYNGIDTWTTCNIYDKMMDMIYEELQSTNLPRVIEEIHEKQIFSLAEMEMHGAPINYDYIIEMVEKATSIIKEKYKKIIAHIDKDLWEKRPKNADGEEKTVEMNLESTAQLLHYLSVKYGIKKSAFWDDDKGKIIADEDSLLEVCDAIVPWIKDYVIFKKALKARNTYLIPFITKSYKGRLYFNLNITGTATGRLSSDNPNLQNLPVSFMGKSKTERIDIKPTIEADEGDTFFNLDFKNLEMKVLTIYCKDPALIKAINDGLDLHCFTASLVNPGVTYEEILAAHQRSEDKDRKDPLTDREKELVDMRQAAKRVIFGVVYGIGAKGLYSKIPLPQHLTKEEKIERAQQLLDNLKKKAYPELLRSFELTDKKILYRGYVQTIFGRRRRFHFSLAKVIADIFLKADRIITRVDPKTGKPYGEDRLHKFELKYIRDIVPNKRVFRQGLNFLVQSSGSDYTQLFIHKFREITNNKHNIKLLFTVHDSCAGTVKDSPGALEFLSNAMEEAGLFYIRTIDPVNMPVDIGYSYEISKKYCEKH